MSIVIPNRRYLLTENNVWVQWWKKMNKTVERSTIQRCLKVGCWKNKIQSSVSEVKKENLQRSDYRNKPNKIQGTVKYRQWISRYKWRRKQTNKTKQWQLLHIWNILKYYFIIYYIYLCKLYIEFLLCADFVHRGNMVSETHHTFCFHEIIVCCGRQTLIK